MSQSSASKSSEISCAASAEGSQETLVQCYPNVKRESDDSTASMSDTYNDSGLSMKLFGDFLVAFSVTFCVSPFTQIIDRGIVEQAAGKHTITASLMQSIATIANSPITYVKSPAFLLMWSVFACTYTTANCCKTLMENQQAQATRRKEAAIDELRRQRKREMSTAMLALKPTHYSSTKSQPLFTLNEWSVLCGTTMVNSGLSLLRDKFYAQMFGTASRASRVPIVTYGFWAIRDCTMVGSSFILPDVVGGMLHERCGINPTDSVRIAQFFCPVFSQFIAGPAHFAGLDFYNRPMKDTPLRSMLFERGSLLANNFVSLMCTNC